MPSTILAIKPSYHDTGACVLRADGNTVSVCAITEARLNRTKHSATFPFLSIDYCLSAMGTSLDQVDMIVFEQMDGRWPRDKISQIHLDYDKPFAPERGDLFFNFLAEQSFLKRWPYYFINHIDAHAASTYFASPFDEAAVLVVEGGTGIYRGKGAALSPIDRHGYGGDLIHDGQVVIPNCDWSMHNTAALYSLVTSQILGMSAYDSGKTMALAAYPGASTFPLSNCAARFFDFLICHDQTLASAFKDLPRFNGDRERMTTAPWIDIASHAQKILEEDMLHLSKLATNKAGSRNLCLAGGVALSCVNNRKLLDSGRFDKIFIQPASSDEGIPLGVALAAYYASGAKTRWRMDTAYLGQPNDRTKLKPLLQSLGITYREASSVEVAALIADGKIIGRCFGASEYGPRALGNRSILADPRRPKMVEHLNRHIKHREGFRPFAPSVLWEKASDYFEMPVEGPFMIMAAQVREHMRSTIPAATHVDGSSRPQTVRHDQNPDYYDLIKAFGDQTGVYVLINTSFNDNEEPIVETYEDALIGLVTCNLDYLYADGFLITRPVDTAFVSRLKEERNARLSKLYGTLIDLYCDRPTWDSWYKRLQQGERINEASAIPSWS